MIKQGASKVTKSKQEAENPILDAGQWQTRNQNQRWEWVETSIWSRNMLAALVNGVKGNKWITEDGPMLTLLNLDCSL